MHPLDRVLAKLSQAGQSLLEITVTLGISVVIVIAITTITIQGLQGSQFAQNQILATKYAQEGLEKIKQLKDSNTGIYISSNNQTYFWYNSPNLIWSFNFSNNSNLLANKFKFDPASCSGVICAPKNISSANDQEKLANFQRIIIFENFAGNQLKVTCKVSWADASGSHESNLVTILSNN